MQDERDNVKLANALLVTNDSIVKAITAIDRSREQSRDNEIAGENREREQLDVARQVFERLAAVEAKLTLLLTAGGIKAEAQDGKSGVHLAIGEWRIPIGPLFKVFKVALPLLTMGAGWFVHRLLGK